MYLTLRISDGPEREALLLAAGRERLRLAVQGCRDVLECRMVAGQWFSEGGEVVEFDSMVAPRDVSGVCGELFPRVCTAGGPMWF
ncbi:MAG TPA: hypothetical protein VGF59_07885 [Bryobacteraceae bacterium]|jgi:hypothetical protein